MIIKTYGIFDTAGKEYVRTFVSKNDETAERAAKYIVREQGFDRIAGKDYVIQHLFDFDNETGLVVDNSIRLVIPLNREIDVVEAEEKERRSMIAKMQQPITPDDVKKGA